MRTNDQVAADFLGELRTRKIVVPAVTTVERLCADALVDAELRIVTSIAERLGTEIGNQLLALLSKTVDDRTNRFVWLRKVEPANSAIIHRMPDRLYTLRTLQVEPGGLDGISPQRVPPGCAAKGNATLLTVCTLCLNIGNPLPTGSPRSSDKP
ncbi:hypothetical protein [Rhizobium azibense]|uniref:Uncharacterized protein n=1 Tax=Rhizobium azibense TaxID=1136135 RepID=A0A4R3RBI5_9HYPH|nr:hypothetical protein [Rhizobium azibense]TCU32780.1 hypothetical protein EV129_1182 [Rhizobium azibense]